MASPHHQPGRHHPQSAPAAHSKPGLIHTQPRQAINAKVLPEFGLLKILRERNWAFHPGFDADGGIDRLKGIRIWPLDGCVDALRIKGQTDAEAMRCDHTNSVLWKREGTVAYVVEQLLELPAPNDPRAPRLALASGPGLWTPR